LKVKNQQDFWAGLLFLVVGVTFALAASKQVLGSASEPGPGYFPLLLGGLLSLLGAWILFLSLTFETDGGNPVGALAWRPAIVVLGAIVLCGAVLPKLGLILTCPLLTVWLHWASPRWEGRWVALSALVTTTLAHLVFVLGLEAPLPLWP
jgi:hypothetical protein